ncbi:adenosylcobinamide-GDP ribazoletransferase [Paludibacter jiangxiensis]|uniref:Adenosylcobinamide-GDP ribazoletransferase n=1 Tax=Paludibacter jiangxiensis TaxID=681398 RepID=A0A171AM98_9BACT|nr:adenosylcobinamide-GDP ribazoletransferase [Paludibacter jiangxiensis]GAT63969.1 adenosylcobinamide-GDP ribazoletransferase [Paludibacter jiangxiensis]
MKKQLHIFLNAIMFYTRIPVPVNVQYSDEILNRSTRYFPFVGWVVGGIGACVYWALSFVMPDALSILLSMLATIFVTGAFHEDGFADFCDGMGGGYTREKILTIMKDSRIGTYGSIGLLGMLATKFTALFSIHDFSIPFVLLAGHSLSRLMPVIVIYTSKYSREDATSKTKPIGKKGKDYDFVMALLFGLGLQWLMPLSFVACILPFMLLTTFIFRRYITKKIGGYTGDCLGALQQITEVEFYLGFVVFQTLIK